MRCFTRLFEPLRGFATAHDTAETAAAHGRRRYICGYIYYDICYGVCLPCEFPRRREITSQKSAVKVPDVGRLRQPVLALLICRFPLRFFHHEVHGRCRRHTEPNSSASLVFFNFSTCHFRRLRMSMTFSDQAGFVCVETQFMLLWPYLGF